MSPLLPSPLASARMWYTALGDMRRDLDLFTFLSILQIQAKLMGAGLPAQLLAADGAQLQYRKLANGFCSILQIKFILAHIELCHDA
jgi:hypothetical protein